MEVTESTTQSQRVGSKPPSADSDLLKLGHSLIIKFHVLMRNLQIYDSKNAALRQFVLECLQIINSLVDKEGSLSLKMVKDGFFLNGQRLRYSVEGFTSFKYLLTQWERKLIGEVIFRGCVDEMALGAFISILVNMEDGCGENAVLFNEHLASQGIPSIEVNPLEVFEEDAAPFRKVDHREAAKRVFFETIGMIKEVITQIKGQQYADVRRLKRLAQNAVYLVMEDESILLGMATIKNYDEYTYNHSINVAIYSLALGRRLGFSRKTLTDLAVTALLHDIGKSKIPKEILNKQGPLSDEEWKMMEKHPLMGVEIVLNLKQLGEINPRMVVGIFEHHLKKSLSGYPRLFRKKEMGLFGRIIQITDCYDAMTTPRIHRKAAYSPEQALAIMLRDRGIQFDPILLKIFIGLVGTYPIGSLVLLSTRETGIVYKPHPDSRGMDRPQVILVGVDGRENRKKEVVDLMETDERGDFKRTIVKSLDPNKYHVDIAKYFL